MCEIGKKFNDINFYNEQMKKSMEDKLFFMEHLPTDHYIFVDFGCADGSLLNTMSSILSSGSFNYTYVGYDISDTMINLAKQNFHGKPNTDIMYTSSWDEVMSKLKKCVDKKKVLILSSVIHEVYSYSDEYMIQQFWNNVMFSDFDYIVIRDMCVSSDIDRETSQYIVNRILGVSSGEIVRQFIDKWGTLQNMKNAVHFLLKYRYRINWERELNENYFPIMFEDLMKKFEETGKYSPMYLERFCVPFITQEIFKDYMITLKDFTHIKVIFKKSFK